MGNATRIYEKHVDIKKILFKIFGINELKSIFQRIPIFQ